MKEKEEGLTRAILIEFRRPRNKHEKGVYGATTIRPGSELTRVFINMDKRRDGEALNTFFHEMVHVWFEQFSAGPIIQSKQEALAAYIGNIVEAVIKT